MSGPHTPGPWTITPIYGVRSVANDRFIASVFGRGEEEKFANGRLIAAAPELFDAAQKALDELISLCQESGSEHSDWPILIKLKAAIMKAEGRP